MNDEKPPINTYELSVVIYERSSIFFKYKKYKFNSLLKLTDISGNWLT